MFYHTWECYFFDNKNKDRLEINFKTFSLFCKDSLKYFFNFALKKHFCFCVASYLSYLLKLFLVGYFFCNILNVNLDIQVIVQVKSTLRVILSWAFLDLIFPMQVLLGNMKSFGKLANSHSPIIPVSDKKV